jgi:hypothetical protein
VNQKEVIIGVAKIRDYLLSTSHPIGRFKALFFFRLGYATDEWEILERDLRALLAGAENHRSVQGPHGVKHIVTGTLTGPNGMIAEVTTVWIVLNEEASMRFVTAYPGGSE